jgi:glutathione S-transferase
MAEQQKDVRVMVEILRYLTDRHDGKPFIAENPAMQQKADALQQDTRLQSAIHELHQDGC